MKKIFILAIALIAIVGDATAQDYNMTVIKTNGDVSTYPLENIGEVTYADVYPDNKEWTSLGYCLYSEDYVSSLVDINEEDDLWCEYYVEVQEKNDMPGLYRLVNPYNPDVYPIISEYPEYFSYDTDNFYFLEINATEPDCVYIDCQDIGLTLDYHALSGRIYAYSFAAYYFDNGYNSADAKSFGYNGTLEDGVITFSQKALASYVAIWREHVWARSVDNSYYGNWYGNFKLDLNDKSDTPGPKNARKKMETNGKEPSFNLNNTNNKGALQLKH